MLELELAGTRLVLLPQRAAFLPTQQTLLVADAHLGKAASFRRLGVPVPRGTTERTLARLSTAIEGTAARRVVFLGDLLHSARSDAPATFDVVRGWRARHRHTELTLVRGNHDEQFGEVPAEWSIETVEAPLAIGALALCHEPVALTDAYVLAGHLHPCAVIGGAAHDRLRLPCFHFGPRVGVLPAFGEFTGMRAVRRQPGDRVFVVQGNEVRLLPCVNTLRA